ncbi:type II toxin-antitoxin system VapC family toxin [Mycolicibacterium hippocampi]|uniref:type II toxin-antitoxin system VapC family toxin n=1 Tax=Mycolicibacterium hippocampi TaxID=659824 RepID=UPI003518041D
MKLVDASVLMYAVNSASEHHAASRRWLDRALSGADIVGLAWVPLLAFARLTTKHGLFPSPLDPRDALAQIREWCEAPSAVLVQPSARHADVFSNLLIQVGTGGNLVNDAHLAALAIEHRGSVVTYDHDFGRFDGIRWDTPESLLA